LSSQNRNKVVPQHDEKVGVRTSYCPVFHVTLGVRDTNDKNDERGRRRAVGLLERPREHTPHSQSPYLLSYKNKVLFYVCVCVCVGCSVGAVAVVVALFLWWGKGWTFCYRSKITWILINDFYR
jgi:hypothetical protein